MYAKLVYGVSYSRVKSNPRTDVAIATKTSSQTISHVVTKENHLFRVKCDHVHGKFAYAINMYCEIVLNSS